MKLADLTHSVVTLIALALGYVIDGSAILALLMAYYFIGRELAQAEYRWIETFGLGRRANMPWWGCFDKRVWNLPSLIDVVPPVLIALVAIAFLGL